MTIEVRIDGTSVKDTKYSAEKILLDTNLLVYAYSGKSSQYPKASCILAASVQGDLRAYVSSQSILEFYSVMTNPKKLTPLLDSQDVGRICLDIFHSRNIGKISPRESSAVEAIVVAERRGLRRRQIFDCLLMVTARENKIERVWTENVSDLGRFEDFLAIENPLDMKWEMARKA